MPDRSYRPHSSGEDLYQSKEICIADSYRIPDFSLVSFFHSFAWQEATPLSSGLKALAIDNVLDDVIIKKAKDLNMLDIAVRIKHEIFVHLFWNICPTRDRQKFSVNNSVLWHLARWVSWWILPLTLRWICRTKPTTGHKETRMALLPTYWFESDQSFCHKQRRFPRSHDKQFKSKPL